MAEAEAPSPEQTSQPRTDFSYLKPYPELTDEERAALSVAELEHYQELAKQEIKQKKRDHRNLMNCLKAEEKRATRAPWEDRNRRNRFLYRLGIGLMYHLAKLHQEEPEGAEGMVKVVLSHLSDTDKPYTSDYYDRWKEAGCPTAEPKSDAEVKREAKAARKAKEKANKTAHEKTTQETGQISGQAAPGAKEKRD